MSEGEKQRGDKGNNQRDKIPRTTQVKRLHAAAKSGKPLKAWAREEKTPLTQGWLEAKRS